MKKYLFSIKYNKFQPLILLNKDRKTIFIVEGMRWNEWHFIFCVLQRSLE